MKKTILKIFSLLLVLLCGLFLTACSSYPSLEKAFTKEGYTVSEKLEELATNLKTELEKNDEELALEVHFLSKGLLNSCIIFEFNKTEKMVEAVENNETLKKYISDFTKDEDVQKVYDSLVETGYAKGNCLVVPILGASEIKQIVKNA